MSTTTDVSGGARIALLVAGVALVSGCGSGRPGDHAHEVAVDQLNQALESAHERALQQRAADPTAGGAAAAERLGHAITDGNATTVVSTAVTDEGLEVVTTVGVRAHVRGALSYEQVSLGACMRTRTRPGSLTGAAGQRGTVSTEAVLCSGGVVPVAESMPVGATTTELHRLRTPVPAAAGPRCLSGSGDCAGG